jgi:hypothetical protein
MNPNPTMKSVSSSFSKKTPRSRADTISRKYTKRAKYTPQTISDLVPLEDRLQEMFTTDPDKVRLYIQMGPRHYHIDPEVILDVNHQANKLSPKDFNYYTNHLLGAHMTMMLQFQAILDQRPDMDEILSKTHWSEEEFICIMRWQSDNQENYRELVLGDISDDDSYSKFPREDFIPV